MATKKKAGNKKAAVKKAKPTPRKKTTPKKKTAVKKAKKASKKTTGKPKPAARKAVKKTVKKAVKKAAIPKAKKTVKKAGAKAKVIPAKASSSKINITKIKAGHAVKTTPKEVKKPGQEDPGKTRSKETSAIRKITHKAHEIKETSAGDPVPETVEQSITPESETSVQMDRDENNQTIIRETEEKKPETEGPMM